VLTFEVRMKEDYALFGRKITKLLDELLWRV
jgi:hypothetical protein